MADTMTKIKQELERFIAALTELAPDEEFGGITLAELKADAATGNAKDQKVEQDAAALEASQDDRKLFYKGVKAKLELVKNGVIGNTSHGPDSPLYGTMGFVRKSERKSGLTRKKKTSKPTES